MRDSNLEHSEKCKRDEFRCTCKPKEGDGGSMKELDVKSIRERCEKATVGEWEWSTFTHHTGREIETNVDVAETTAFSAMQSERAELFGIALKEKDEEGRNIVVCYTGNGPNSHNNSEFLANAKQDIPNLLEALGSTEQLVKELAEQSKRISSELSQICGRMRWMANKLQNEGGHGHLVTELHDLAEQCVADYIANNELLSDPQIKRITEGE